MVERFTDNEEVDGSIPSVRTKGAIRFHPDPHNMSDKYETFFTTVGCMDGRAQGIVAGFGRKKFGAIYPDTITEAGLVGVLSKQNVDNNLIKSLKKKILISLEKHRSKGIIIHGHQECAGNPVEDKAHRDDIRKSIQLIKSLIKSSIPVVGVFVKRSQRDTGIWEVEEL